MPRAGPTGDDGIAALSCKAFDARRVAASRTDIGERMALCGRALCGRARRSQRGTIASPRRTSGTPACSREPEEWGDGGMVCRGSFDGSLLKRRAPLVLGKSAQQVGKTVREGLGSFVAALQLLANRRSHLLIYFDLLSRREDRAQHSPPSSVPEGSRDSYSPTCTTTYVKR